MLSSKITTNVSSNLIQPTPMNSSTTKNDLYLPVKLHGPLAAPAGWHSEIIHSNSPIPTDDGINIINTNANYGGYNTINTLNTSQTNQIPSQFLNNNVEYINENSIHQQQSIFTEQQQQNLINIVENQNPPPLIVRKTLPNNLVTYQQNVSVRYLKPPTPPPPGPLIIREVRPPPPRPQSPIKIRQRPQPPPTPPPIILREQPPPIPPRTPAKIIDKLLPPPPPPPRRVILERYEPCPPKPPDVVIERWLPYKQPPQPRVLLEPAPPLSIPPQEPNLLILHNAPHARINKQFINQGVVRADPDSYLRQYGAELQSWHSDSQHGYLIDEATRIIPPPLGSSRDHYDYRASYLDEYQRPSSPYISNTWERTRVASPIPRSSSYSYGYSHYDSPYHYGYSDYDSPNHYCNQSRYGYDSYRSYDDYPIYHGSHLTMKDVTPSWNSYCNSSPYDPYYRSSSSYPYYRSSSSYPYYQSSSSYPSDTIRVRSDNELCHVLCDLTNGRVPPALRSY